jgi:nitrate/TMAO reductase-like tetraheme cytochrome c subunit
MPKKSPLLPLAISAILVVLLLAAGGFAYASNMDQNNTFCGSCHTQPETSYLQRATAPQPVDMASYHILYKGKRCIDCHSGAGLTGRLAAEFQGALNALHWYTGTAVQPAVLVHPISDATCLKCHQKVTAERSLENHFHGDLAKWQAADPQAGSCVSCHSGHATTSNLVASFSTDQAQDKAVCDACHLAIRSGPE